MSLNPDALAVERMELFDDMPPDVRAVVHDYGLALGGGLYLVDGLRGDELRMRAEAIRRERQDQRNTVASDRVAAILLAGLAAG